MKTEVLPYINIRPSFITQYVVSDLTRARSSAQIFSEKNLTENKANPEVSAKAKKRIRQAIDWLLFGAKRKFVYDKYKNKTFSFKINFVTLTLSSEQKHSDNEIKSKLLNQFLIEAKKRWHVNRYLWRAEAQKNGNIHFHIATDVFIPYWELNKVWNRIQNKLGYVDEFCKKFPGHTPNSTDVHSVWKIRNISAYLAGYCCKKSKNRAIEGKIWGLSTSLSCLKSCSVLCVDLAAHEFHFLRKKFLKKFHEFNYCSCLFVNVKEWANTGCNYLYNKLLNYVNPTKQTIIT